ncbi:MAG TPA: hypothetical protein VMW05_09855 [Methyloceanibacter sp.]|nr:hypothetical protein [Methyloceanibacter sp.]
MTYSKTLAHVLIAAVLVAGAGPAFAKKYQTADGTIVKKQSGKKATGAQSKKNCVLTAPPFMRNPRYMNRGFFKKKCYDKGQ